MSEFAPADLKNAAYDEAARFALPPDWQEGREQTVGVTIDSEKTRDRDDAILMTRSGDSRNLITSIADTGTFLAGSAGIEPYAREMGETRYLRTGNVTMIPPRVSEGVMSILDDKRGADGAIIPTPVLSVRLSMERDGSFGPVEFSRDSMTPIARSYNAIAKLVTARNNTGESAQFRAYQRTGEKLLRDRRQQGAIAFYDRKQGLMTDDDGNIRRLHGSGAGELIVQEFMILTNTAVATYALQHNIPVLYRNHKFRKNANPADLQQLLAGEELNAELFKSVYGRARYSPDCEGHVGLSLPAYMHFTSPLRRFADFVNHANLVAHIEGRPYPYPREVLPDIAQHLNDVQDITRASKRESAVFTAARERLHRNPAVAAAAGETAVDAELFSAQLAASITIGEISAELIADTQALLIANKLTPSDMAYLLFNTAKLENADVAAIREKVAAHLFAHPEHAPRVLNAAKQNGILVNFNISSKHSGNRFTATADATDRSGERHSAFYEHRARLRSGQRASGLLLAQMVGYTPPEPEPLPEQPATLTGSTKTAPVSGVGSGLAPGEAPEGSKLETRLDYAKRDGVMPESLVADLTTRLEDDSLTVGNMVFIVSAPHISGGGLEELRAKVYQQLQLRPSLAYSVFEAAAKAHTIRSFTIRAEDRGNSRFEATVAIIDNDGNEHTATITALGKKNASQLAAVNVMAALNGTEIAELPATTEQASPPASHANPKSELQERYAAARIRMPSYETTGSGTKFTSTVHVMINDEERAFTAQASNKKDAERMAAEAALVEAHPSPFIKPRKTPPPAVIAKRAAAEKKPAVKSGAGPINQLQNAIFKKLGVNPVESPVHPVYEVGQPTGESHAPTFHCTVTFELDDQPYSFTGSGSNKQKASDAAAAEAVRALFTDAPDPEQP
jgi:ribonuclease R